MPEVVRRLGGIEHPDERANALAEVLNGSLGELAQEGLQLVKEHLNRIEVRRILGEIAQFGADSPDRLLDTDNMMGRKIVDDHGVPALERRTQALLKIGEEGFRVHGPLEDHRGYDPGATQAGNERHGLPLPLRHNTDETLASWASTVQSHHIGGHRGLIDEYKSGWIKQTLIANPPPAGARDVGTLLLCGPQAFF